MNRRWGFTLVELLVVIAIISILAAIIVPNVQGYILRSRMASTFATTRTIETEMASMLTHANKDRFIDLFENPPGGGRATTLLEFEDQVDRYTKAFYALLRLGRNVDPGVSDLSGVGGSGLFLAPGVREKLAVGGYLPELGQDPWDQLYRFWTGTWAPADPNASPDETAFPLRCYRAPAITDDGTVLPWKYSAANETLDETGAPEVRNRKQELDAQIPGNPPLDESYGYPAPKGMSIYIWSTGVNARTDQNYDLPPEDEYRGGGDDINNWDGEQGWTGFYTG